MKDDKKGNNYIPIVNKYSPTNESYPINELNKEVSKNIYEVMDAVSQAVFNTLNIANIAGSNIAKNVKYVVEISDKI